jgi:hypothetical protein
MSVEDLSQVELAQNDSGEICQKCFCDQSADHDCIKSLLESKQIVIQNNEELQNELQIAKDRISSLESEIEDYTATIQGLISSNQQRDRPSFTKVRITSNEQILLFFLYF